MIEIGPQLKELIKDLVQGAFFLIIIYWIFFRRDEE